MKNGKPEHYWRIHNRVSKRVLLDTPEGVRHVIASDTAHETPEFKWFETKVNEDTERLFTDESYYDNQEFTFRVPKY